MILKDKRTGDVIEIEGVVLVAPMPGFNENNPYDDKVEYPTLCYDTLEELLEKWEVVENDKHLHRGSLDYCEFVISPANIDSTPEQIVNCAEVYLKNLGMSDIEIRWWLLDSLQKLRKGKNEPR